ncbi:28S ribosomal protein S18c, mitochondrial-like [Echinops telfairi]|uniref:28S ribosomal protein S18c, mitochondrial-like n=1 Tax=Echinops telfairi TaxID=9371 RepID=A0ABM1VMD1_ECHTE|nr:28S ribosomal protein S18c, mitochondrial-like [Echinops telfairi]
MVAVCSALGRKTLMHFTTAAASFTDSRSHTVVYRRACSPYEQVTSSEDLLLSQFISPFTGCIYSRHITGLCGKKQKEITKAIKRAQIMGFLPFSYKDPALSQRPQSL